jgi:hypothetical protein
MALSFLSSECVFFLEKMTITPKRFEVQHCNFAQMLPLSKFILKYHYSLQNGGQLKCLMPNPMKSGNFTKKVQETKKLASLMLFAIISSFAKIG